MISMLSITYTLTPQLKEILSNVEINRQKILLTVLPPSTLRKLQFDAERTRLSALARTFDTQLTVPIGSLIDSSKSPKEASPEQLIVNYRKTLAILAEEWIASPRQLTIGSLGVISELLSYRMKRNTRFRTAPDQEIRMLTDYLTVREDHAIVTAGILYAGIILLSEARELHPFALASAYLILYKHGFDSHRLLTLEEQFIGQRTLVDRALTDAQKTGSLTLWLEVFAGLIAANLTGIVQRLHGSLSLSPQATKNYRLSEREREILSIFTDVHTTVTNRVVQKKCGISQITASRDLARLASIGVLSKHGRGRSIYYTKL